jgi:hypothetical protein
LFKKESHYLWTATVLLAAYVLFMHCVFDVAWTDSAAWARILNVAQDAVPAIRRLHDDAPSIYTNYWGVFFLGFWVMSPIYWLLGAMGAPFLSDSRRKRLTEGAPFKRVVSMFSIFIILMIFVYEFPVLNGMGIYNETSRFLPILALTWWIVAMLVYYQGQASRVLWQRLRLIFKPAT